MPKNKTLKWVAAQLRPNMLSKTEINLYRQSIEFFAPKRYETIRYGKIFKKIQKLLFPGYIFIRLDPNSLDVRKVNSTIGISRVVKMKHERLSFIPDAFVENLKILSTEHKFFSSDQVKPGRKIKWIDGPFSGMVGEILSLDENGRLRILFKVLQGYRIVLGKANRLELA